MKKLKGIFGKGKGANASSQQSGGASASHNVNGYDLKEKDLPKIHKAAWTGDIAKVKQLAKKDSSLLDKENRTPLHLACANGHAQVVQELLEWNAKTNVGDNAVKTPLMKAVECNQEECVKLLLEYRKAEIDAKDGENNTALHIAIKHSNTHLVSLLIDAGASVNLKNKYGQTPLILSVLDPSKKDSITRMLLEHDAEINAADNNRRSALHHACMEDGINQVKLLLEYNANTALKDTKGWTAEDCAMMKANHACSQVVFDHNLKSRRVLGGSVPSTPRAESVNLSRHTTPRDKSVSEVSGFGMPQGHQEDADDSDDQTVSKNSLHDNRQDSWADDTDISAADDKLKPAAVKTSLTKHINIHSDDEEVDDIEQIDDDGIAGADKTGDLQPKVRPMYSRTPTPDRDLSKSPGSVQSPQARSTPSKIPLKKKLSGASHTSVEEDFSDDEDDSSPVHRGGGRVSFSERQEIRNINSGGYTPTTPTGYQFDPPDSKPMSKDKIKAFHAAIKADLGLDDISDVSDPEGFDDSEPIGGTNSQPTTPRSILKKTETSGKPPSVQNAVDTDDEESDWDSTKQSLTEKGSQSIQIREEVESPEIDSDIENTLNPEKSITSKTSQWDSSDEAYTPRTPRDASQAFRHTDLSPDVQEFEYEDESESRTHDHIREAVTSFGVQQTVPQSPSFPTPEPQSDSSALRSRDTPDPPTSSNSASNVKTIIAATVEEPEESPRDSTPRESLQDQEDNSDWDSEDDVQSDDDGGGSTPVVGLSSPVVVGIDSVNNTPRTPRGEKSEEESVSEWELEREKEKEKKRQDEMRILQEMEEEEERQRKWEEEERRRQAQIEREAQEELERERLAAGDGDSEVSDFSDNQLPDSVGKPTSEHSYNSQHASQRSQQSDHSERSQRSESITSPRAMGEVENESPAPDILLEHLIQPVQQTNRFTTPDFPDKPKDSGDMYGNPNGDDDEESDNDIEEINDEQADTPPEIVSETDEPQQYNVNTNTGGDSQHNVRANIPNKPSPSFVTQERFDDDYDVDDVDDDYDVDDVGDDDDVDEFEDVVDAQVIVPETMKKVEAAVNHAPPAQRTELPTTVTPSPQTVNGALTEPPPLPKTGPPGKAMSLQSDGQSADEDYIESHIHLNKSPGPSGLPDISGTTGLYSSGLEVPFDDDGLSVTSTENGDISNSYRPESLPYGKDMLVNMNLSDSNSILKLQEHLREHRKQLEYERNQKMLLESRQKQSAKDKQDLQKMIDSLKYQKSALEQSKLDLEARIRNLEYSVNDEEEKKKNAELLLKKTKEQLAKKEEQYSQEMEAKQRAELSMRNVQMELRSAQNAIKDLEEEKAELERQWTNEKNARQLQEKINEEQQRLQQHMHEESLKTTSQKRPVWISHFITDDESVR